MLAGLDLGLTSPVFQEALSANILLPEMEAGWVKLFLEEEGS